MLLPFVWRLLTRRPTFHAGPPRQSMVPVRMTADSFARLPDEEMHRIMPNKIMEPAGVS